MGTDSHDRPVPGVSPESATLWREPAASGGPPSTAFLVRQPPRWQPPPVLVPRRRDADGPAPAPEEVSDEREGVFPRVRSGDLRARRAEDFAKGAPLTPAAAEAALNGVRKRAEAWRTGTAAILTLVTATLVVTDVSKTVHVFDPGGQRLLSMLLVVSALTSLAGLAFVLRAANGPSWLDTRQYRNRWSDAQRDSYRARAAAWDLHCGQVLLAVGVAVFVLLVAVTWGMTPETVATPPAPGR